MRQSSAKAGQVFRKDGQLSPECAERAIAFLRRAHPSKTAEEVEAATGGRVCAGSVRKWLSRGSSPSFFACMALILAYGPEFLAAVLDEAPGWLSAAAREQRQRHLEDEQKRIAAQLAALSASN